MKRLEDYKGNFVIFTFLLVLISGTSCCVSSEKTEIRQVAPAYTPEPAPDFTLINQDGEEVSLSDYRGKVVLINFIFARCMTVCPILTSKFAKIQGTLGDKFGRDVFLISISFDTEHDAPKVLKQYAEQHGANLSGWAFLTGSEEDIKKVTNDYGVWYNKTEDGMFEHTALTVVVDQNGMKQKEYYGYFYDESIAIKDVNELLTS